MPRANISMEINDTYLYATLFRVNLLFIHQYIPTDKDYLPHSETLQ